MPTRKVAFQFECRFFVGCECQSVLEGPQCADSGHVAALGTKESVKIQALDVIEF
jgi:hypothetical protein